MYRSELEKLWLRRSVIKACLGPISQYEHTRREAEYDAEGAELECPDGRNEYHSHEDGEDPSEVAEHVYQRIWNTESSEKDLAFDSGYRTECGSIREILHLADSLAQAILAANKSGCESKIYGIHRVKVD
jgi:hypothetical protein